MNKKLINSGLIFLMAFPFLINITFMGRTTSITYGTTESWIGFFTSYAGGIFGGLIGGLFTYLGVKQTISNQARQKYIDEFPGKINLLRETILELEKNMIYLAIMNILLKVSSHLKIHQRILIQCRF
ncbi:hypothetical protein [Paenibacillus shenyangensis]|uniref:hypothetical protein n=1 Tax=Paenibacillus sp. A9 TaxID=1284352 RepID=UPI000380D370|nr:hypothetical protein [Paenibacillus sp. A9]